MKNFLKGANGFLFVTVMAILIAALFQLPVTPTIGFALIVSAFLPSQSGAMRSTIVESWANYLIERFWKDNKFLRMGFDDSQYVKVGRIVHIPQIGSKPNVVKNRSVFPATAVRRADTDVVYALDEYSTDPTHIPNIDSIQISYSKQDSVLGDHQSVLDETVADDMILKWAANAANYKTTGANGTATPSTQAPVAGTAQTGTRLAFTHRDVKTLSTKMNLQNVSGEDRNMLLDAWMYDGLMESLSDSQYKDFSQYFDARTGIIGKLYGFNIMTRSSVLAMTNTDTVKALGSTLAATDNLASLAWQKNSVAFALGETKLFQNLNDPLYYGDIYSSLIMAGGRVRRGDGLGIFTIEQG